jgi:hypothetical protein
MGENSTNLVTLAIGNGRKEKGESSIFRSSCSSNWREMRSQLFFSRLIIVFFLRSEFNSAKWQSHQKAVTTAVMFLSLWGLDIKRRKLSGTVASRGCQMVYFQTRNRNFGKLWRVLLWKYIDIFYGHLVNFTAT